MKKLLLLLILFVSSALQSQTVTKEKLTGKWKMIAMYQDSTWMDIQNEKSFEEMMYKEILKSNPEHYFTKEDSLMVKETVRNEIMKLFKGIRIEIEFLADGTFKALFDADKLNGQKKKRSSGKYEFKDGKLEMTGKKGPKTADISMPDDNTLILFAEEMKIKFTRQ